MYLCIAAYCYLVTVTMLLSLIVHVGTDRRQLVALISRYMELTGMFNKGHTAALQMLNSTWTNQLSHVEVWAL